MEKDFVDLFELQTRVKEAIEISCPGRTWVKAEISSLKARYGSHCYMELSQSDDRGLVAKVRAVAWASNWRLISAYFREVTQSELAEGMEVLMEVEVSYSQLYGLSLVVIDIDPEFTLGAKEDARQKTIDRLVSEGLIDMQRELAPPALPYRIAVISAPDAAGYRDFMKHLSENEYGFVFQVDLFPAVMQGATAPESIASALSEVASARPLHDVVMIMRGGGAKLDLACFDEYAVASAIARCPLPVLTAIGHDQDYHVADMVANHSVKTPTALADWLIDIYVAEDERIASYVARLKLAFMNKVALMQSRVENLRVRILAADPRNILSRGYTLTLGEDGKVVRSAASLKAGEKMTIMFPDGSVRAVVSSIEKNGEKSGENETNS